MDVEQDNGSFTEQGMPTHQQLVVYVIQAVIALGGSAKSKEIVDQVLDIYPQADELLKATYPSNGVPVLADRIAWARSTAKLIGALEQPARGMYLTTEFGEKLLRLSADESLSIVKDREREYAREHRLRRASDSDSTENGELTNADSKDELRAAVDTEAKEPDDDWKSQLLARLHKLTPEGFEKFVIYLLRKYGLELTHVGGSGDEGIDGIGTAPLSPVLSSRVAVQVKRYAPTGNPIGRETVALFQRDAQTKGAERAILVTLGRFTDPARKAATSSTPTVDLINGDRLAELILNDGESGVTLQPKVNESWFKKFE